MKMILIECCDKCPYFGEGVCSETMKHNRRWNQIADFCPKQDAPQFGVTITDETYRPEDGTTWTPSPMLSASARSRPGSRRSNHE